MKPHRNEWARLRKKYWRAHVNFGRNHKKKRLAYWGNEVKRLGRRLGKLAAKYPPLPLANPAGPVSVKTLRKQLG